MKKVFKTMAFTLLGLVLSVNLWAADPVVLFHETFGDNSGSARAWSDTYSVKSGVTDVYSGVSYTMTNVKQGKNTTGQTKSGLNQSTQNVDAIFEFGPLDVTDYKTLNLSHYWKPGSTKGTYTTKVYFKTSKNGTYTEITHSAVGGGSFVQVSVNIPSAADKCETLYLKIVFNTSNTQAIIDEVELQGVFDGATPTEPSLSVSPTTIDFGEVEKNATVEGKEVTVTMENIDEVLVGFSTNSPFSVNKESLTESGKIIITPTAATLAEVGEYSDDLIVTDGDKLEKTVAVSIKVKEPAAPTGTFEKFTGDLVEGDYVICDGTDAMNNTTKDGPRIGYQTISVSNDKIENPDEAVIWHIAASTTEGYWTIYNASAAKYAAFTSTDARGTLLENITDYALWQYSTVSSNKEFSNKGKTSKYLRKNGTYGFASYSTSTGTSLTLYKKSNGLETVTTPTFSPAAGLYEAEQDITISCTTAGASIYYTTDGTAPTTGSTPYTGTFKLAENKTIKAIAVKEGMNNSSVASATYTFALPYTSLAEFVSAAPTTESALVLEAADGVVIIGATSKNLYVQDAAGTTMILYNASAAPAWTVGKRIEGKLTGTFTTYQGMNEMVLATWNNANANNDGTMPEPAVLTELTESTFATHFGKYIKMEGQYFQSTGLSSNAVDTKNAGQTITSKMYNTFGVMTGKTLPSMDDATVVEGVFIKYNSDYELAVTSIAAGDAKINVDPVGGADAVNAVALAMNAQVTVTPVAGFATKLNSNPITEATTVTIDEAKSITVVSNRDFYTEKSVTYYYKVDESAKAVTINQPEVGGTIAANPVSGVAGDIITLTYEAAAHYNFGSFSVMAGETPVTVSENAGVYTFEMPNANVTVSATFNIMSQYTATFVAGAQTATGSVDPIARYMDELEIQLPANGFAYAGHVFAGWSDGSTVKQPGENYTLAGDKEFTATWEELPIWAYTYTSNVEISADASQKVTWEEVSYDCVKTNKGASATIKVPANTTELHFHIAAWNGEGQTVTIKKGETTLTTIGVTADAGVANNSPYTLQNDPATTDYFSVALSDIAEETTITIAGASGKRFVLFGVNAIQPAAITIAPAEKNFGEVKQGFDAEQVFSLTPNAFATGTITAEIDGEGFSASAVTDNKVTVTFAPTEIKDYNATLIIKHDGTQMCTATLTGKGITATNPEIVVPDEPVDFGKVKQDATIADKTVTVTLNYLDAATASISDDTYFSIDKTELVAGENTITISATAATSGEKSATITITGTGATTKTIAVKMDVTSKWAGEYTSNVEVGSDKVIISEEEYEAHKAGGGKTQGSTTITVPEGAYALHFHAAGWNSESVTLKVSNGTTELTSKNLFADAGFKGNGPSYTLEGENYDSDQYFYVEFDALEEETKFTFAATSGNRFVLYGVNQEGGILPVLDHITIDGEATKLNYNTTDAFDPVGLTVSAVYTLKGVEQTPVPVTEDVNWTFDPATFNEVGEGLSVTATASFTDGEVTKTADKVITGISVEEATPSIVASRVNIEFGEVTQGATVEDIQSKITLKYIDEVSVTLSDATAFEIDKTSMTETGYLTISAVTTAEVGEYTATVTIKDLASETSKVLNLSITINETPRPTIYSPVTDASTLKAGDVIVMAATYSNNTYVNGDLSGDLLTCVEATIANGKLTAIGACEFTLGGEAGAWTLTSTAGKLGATAAKKLTYDNTKTNFVNTWTISISDNVATITSNGEGYGRFLYNHNNGSPRFLTYTSNTSATMLLPQIYRLGIAEEVSASTLAQNADVVINEGGSLVVDAPKTLGDIVVAVGGTVTLETNTTLTVNNFVIKSTMAGGESGQVLGVTSTNFTITGSAYYDVVLGDNGNSDKWHAFAVPFNVDAINGVYDLDDNKLTNEVNYAIMDYHGDVRAEGKYGWKKFSGIMNPGVFYLMTVDGQRTTYRMKMKDGFQAASSSITVTSYTGAGTTTDYGWNGIANNQLTYSSVAANVQVLNPSSYTFETKTTSSTNFTVGTPFFYQANGEEEDGKITLAAANSDKPAYAPRMTAEAKNIEVNLSNNDYTDRLYISATDEATNAYQIGRDLAKMTMTSAPAVPQIFAEAYGTKLSMIDVPMVNDQAIYTLNLYAPANGEYTMGAAQVEGYEVFLTQYGSVIWNLSMSEATIDLTKGNNTEYGLILKATGAHAPTDINTINGQESVQKFFFNSNIYIRHNNKTYGVTGQLVK